MTSTNGRDGKTGRFVRGNKAAVKHGAWSLARSGQVPSVRGARELSKRLEYLQSQLEEITPNMTPQKEIVIGQIVKTQGMLSMLELYLRKHGILRPDQFRRGIITPQPALSTTYLSLLNSQRRAIECLGLEPVQVEEAMTPFEIIQKQERSEDGHRTGD